MQYGRLLPLLDLLGWYWRRQRTSWIRNSVTVFHCRKKFHAWNFRGYWQPRKIFNSENFPIYGTQPSLHCYYNFPGGFCSELRLELHQWWAKHMHNPATLSEIGFDFCMGLPHLHTRVLVVIPSSHIASFPGSPPTQQRWTVRRGRAWYPFARDATELTSRIYQYVSLDVTHVQTVRSVTLCIWVWSLGPLKRKGRPGYAIDDARQFAGTSFCHRSVRNE